MRKTFSWALLLACSAVAAVAQNTINGIPVITVNGLHAVSAADGSDVIAVWQSSGSAPHTRGEMVDQIKTYTLTGYRPAWSSIDGTPTTLGGYGITDAQPLNSNLSAWAALNPGGDITIGGTMTASGIKLNDDELLQGHHLKLAAAGDSIAWLGNSTLIGTDGNGSPYFQNANGTTLGFDASGNPEFGGVVYLNGTGLVGDGSQITGLAWGHVNATAANTAFVDAVNGIDGTGAIGSQSHPYLTIGAAVTAANAVASSTNPVVVKVGPGTFTETRLACSPYVSLVGSGSAATIIQSTALLAGDLNNVAIWSPGSNTSNGWFTLNATNSESGVFQVPIGPNASGTGTATACTNAIVNSVMVNGNSDCVYVDRTTTAVTMSFYNCVFNSKFDTVNFVGVGGELDFYNCTCTAKGPFYVGSIDPARCLVAGGSASSIIRFFGGILSATGSSNGTGVSDLFATSYVEVRGTLFNTSGTFSSTDIDATSGGTVGISGCSRADKTILTYDGTAPIMLDAVALNLGALATVTPGTGVATAAGQAVNTSSGLVTQSGADTRYVPQASSLVNPTPTVTGAGTNPAYIYQLPATKVSWSGMTNLYTPNFFSCEYFLAGKSAGSGATQSVRIVALPFTPTLRLSAFEETGRNGGANSIGGIQWNNGGASMGNNPGPGGTLYLNNSGAGSSWLTLTFSTANITCAAGDTLVCCTSVVGTTPTGGSLFTFAANSAKSSSATVDIRAITSSGTGVTTSDTVLYDVTSNTSFTTTYTKNTATNSSSFPGNGVIFPSTNGGNIDVNYYSGNNNQEYVVKIIAF